LEYRKLIKFGNSSYVISIPQKWINSNSLQKGDLIYFTENGNNELVLAPYANRQLTQEKEITIDIKDKSEDTIIREIVSAYTNNYSTIELVGDLGSRGEIIEKALYNLIALEIIEHTRDRIVIKDFLDLKDITLDTVIRRIDLVVRSIIQESKNSINGKNQYENIKHMDVSVNRFRFLINRVVKTGLRNNEILKSLNVKSPLELLSYWRVVGSLENIADEARRISRYLKDIQLEKNEKEELLKLYNEIEANYLEVIKAYYNSDKVLANSISSKKFEIITICNKFLDKNKANARLVQILERLKAIESGVRDITRVIVDKDF